MSPRNSFANRSRRIAICAMLSALAVVFIAIGGLIEIMDLTAAAAASLILLPILLTYGPRYAIMAYAVAGILGVILMPQSMAAWVFLGLVGYYPIIKRGLDRLPKALGYLVKMLLVAAVMILYLLLFYFVFMQGQGTFLEAFQQGFGEPGGSSWLPWALIVLSLFTFFIFDLLIDRLLILYRLKWQKRVEKWMK